MDERPRFEKHNGTNQLEWTMERPWYGAMQRPKVDACDESMPLATVGYSMVSYLVVQLRDRVQLYPTCQPHSPLKPLIL